MRLLAASFFLSVSLGAAPPCCEVVANGTEKMKGRLGPGSTKQYNAVYVRVRNNSPSPVLFDPSAFSLVTTEGRALPAIAPRLAAERMVNRVARWLSPREVDGGSNLSNSSKHLLLKIEQQAVPPGPIPPGSFVEGVVYFEAARKKLKSAELRMTGFDEDPILVEW